MAGKYLAASGRPVPIWLRMRCKVAQKIGRHTCPAGRPDRFLIYAALCTDTPHTNRLFGHGTDRLPPVQQRGGVHSATMASGDRSLGDEPDTMQLASQAYFLDSPRRRLDPTQPVLPSWERAAHGSGTQRIGSLGTGVLSGDDDDDLPGEAGGDGARGTDTGSSGAPHPHARVAAAHGLPPVPPLAHSRSQSTMRLYSPFSQRSMSGTASSSHFVVIVPPPDLPFDSLPSRNASAVGSTDPSHLRRGMLLPLYPTLGGQLYAVAREFGLPSVGGLSLYLIDDGNGVKGPRIGDATWSALWSGIFEDGGASAALDEAIDDITTRDLDEGAERTAPLHYNRARSGASPTPLRHASSSASFDTSRRTGRVASNASVGNTSGSSAASFVLRTGRLPIVGRFEWAVDPRRAKWWSKWVAHGEEGAAHAGSGSDGSDAPPSDRGEAPRPPESGGVRPLQLGSRGTPASSAPPSAAPRERPPALPEAPVSAASAGYATAEDEETAARPAAARDDPAHVEREHPQPHYSVSETMASIQAAASRFFGHSHDSAGTGAQQRGGQARAEEEKPEEAEKPHTPISPQRQSWQAERDADEAARTNAPARRATPRASVEVPGSVRTASARISAAAAGAEPAVPSSPLTQPESQPESPSDARQPTTSTPPRETAARDEHAPGAPGTAGILGAAGALAAEHEQPSDDRAAQDEPAGAENQWTFPPTTSAARFSKSRPGDEAQSARVPDFLAAVRPGGAPPEPSAAPRPGRPNLPVPPGGATPGVPTANESIAAARRIGHQTRPSLRSPITLGASLPDVGERAAPQTAQPVATQTPRSTYNEDDAARDLARIRALENVPSSHLERASRLMEGKIDPAHLTRQNSVDFDHTLGDLQRALELLSPGRRGTSGGRARDPADVAEILRRSGEATGESEDTPRPRWFFRTRMASPQPGPAGMRDTAAPETTSELRNTMNAGDEPAAPAPETATEAPRASGALDAPERPSGLTTLDRLLSSEAMFDTSNAAQQKDAPSAVAFGETNVHASPAAGRQSGAPEGQRLEEMLWPTDSAQQQQQQQHMRQSGYVPGSGAVSQLIGRSQKTASNRLSQELWSQDSRHVSMQSQGVAADHALAETSRREMWQSGVNLPGTVTSTEPGVPPLPRDAHTLGEPPAPGEVPAAGQAPAVAETTEVHTTSVKAAPEEQVPPPPPPKDEEFMSPHNPLSPPRVPAPQAAEEPTRAAEPASAEPRPIEHPEQLNDVLHNLNVHSGVGAPAAPAEEGQEWAHWSVPQESAPAPAAAEPEARAREQEEGAPSVGAALASAGGTASAAAGTAAGAASLGLPSQEGGENQVSADTPKTPQLNERAKPEEAADESRDMSWLSTEREPQTSSLLSPGSPSVPQSAEGPTSPPESSSNETPSGARGLLAKMSPKFKWGRRKKGQSMDSAKKAEETKKNAGDDSASIKSPGRSHTSILSVGKGSRQSNSNKTEDGDAQSNRFGLPFGFPNSPTRRNMTLQQEDGKVPDVLHGDDAAIPTQGGVSSLGEVSEPSGTEHVPAMPSASAAPSGPEPPKAPEAPKVPEPPQFSFDAPPPESSAPSVEFNPAQPSLPPGSGAPSGSALEGRAAGNAPAAAEQGVAAAQLSGQQGSVPSLNGHAPSGAAPGSAQPFSVQPGQPFPMPPHPAFTQPFASQAEPMSGGQATAPRTEERDPWPGMPSGFMSTHPSDVYVRGEQQASAVSPQTDTLGGAQLGTEHTAENTQQSAESQLYASAPPAAKQPPAAPSGTETTAAPNAAGEAGSYGHTVQQNLAFPGAEQAYTENAGYTTGDSRGTGMFAQQRASARAQGIEAFAPTTTADSFSASAEQSAGNDSQRAGFNPFAPGMSDLREALQRPTEQGAAGTQHTADSLEQRAADAARNASGFLNSGPFGRQ